MAELKFPAEVQWARFYLHLTNQIASAMRRATEEAEALTEQLRKQKELIEEQNAILEERDWMLQNCAELQGNVKNGGPNA